ncbi:hypothetical protein [Variovorax paradoxus]|uniref:hypothetical protein n=1 Tax=Variovorax paradoxus TaxID=34073 RepID=UPI0005ABF385|nr:hypothetical protein [Variovorax paradoxus]
MSMPMHEVRATVETFLRGTEPEVLAVAGGWGVGKTHLWRTTLDTARVSETLGLRSYGYVSLFGLSSLDQLKLSLFESTLMLTPDAETKSVWGRVQSAIGDRVRLGYVAGPKALRQQLTSDAVTGARLSRRYADGMPFAIASISKALSPLYFSAVHDQLVCIDDIERRGEGLKLNELLGLITFLKEERRCRVALLLNSDSLSDGDKKLFESQLEKVIDIHVRMAPTSQESVAIAFGEQPDQITAQIAERASVLGIRNVRVLRRIARLIGSAKVHFAGFHPKVAERAIFILTVVGWVIYEPAEAPTSWHNEAVEAANSPGDWHAFAAEDESRTPTKDDETMSRYGYTFLNNFDLTLIKEAQRGFFDPALLRKIGAEMQREIETLESNATIQEAWNIVFDSFDNNEEEAAEKIFTVTSQCREFASLSDLNRAVAFLETLGASDKVDELLSLYKVARASDASFWSLEDQWILGKFEPSVAAIARTMHQEELPFDPEEALIKIGERSGNSQDDSRLAMLGPDGMKNLFMSMKGRRMRNVVVGSLQYASLTNPDPQQQKLLANARQALEEIASSSPLNKWRVERYSGVRAGK